jgi:DNA-binding LacI/PurR family transcriptional regulator
MATDNSTPPRTKKPARVRMIDIARQAGVSRPLVSFVLSGGKHADRVHPKTAARIRRIAKQLDFHPNHAAQQLAGKRSGVLGALASNWVYLPLRPRFLAYLNRAADARGQKILTWQTNLHSGPVEQFIGEFHGRGVDGLIYLAFDNDCEWPSVAPLLARLPYVVTVMSDAGIEGGSCVLSDVADGARQAVEHLHRQGGRKIVQILDSHGSSNRQRQEGFSRAHEELGRPLGPDQLCIATRGWSEDDFPKFVALAEDLVRQRGADAILADNDMGAVLLMRALPTLGLRVPQDVAVVGWGAEMVSRYTTPSLTTVDYRLDAIMESVLDIMTGLIDGPDETEPKSVTIRPALIVREST